MPTEIRPVEYRTLFAACAAISVFGLAFGMTYPLLSIILEQRGVSSDMIGINSAMMPLGILLFSPLIPLAATRFGARNLAIGAALVTALAILAYKAFDTLSAWFLIRLIQGMTISTLFVLSEAWIVGSSGDRNRGKIVAIYASILSASFGAGPLLISFIGIDGWLPFLLGALVVGFGILPLLLLRETPPEGPDETPTSGVFSFAGKAPLLLLTVAVFSIFDAAALSLFPVYGMQNGLDIATSANILTALILGNVLLQLPVGWLADRYAYRKVTIACALITAVALLTLPWLILSPARWPLLVLAGTTGYGIYTLALAALGNRFRGAELVQGSASFAIVWGTGALIGSISGGWLMTGFGPHGLPVGLALVYALLGFALLRRQLSRRRLENPDLAPARVD